MISHDLSTHCGIFDIFLLLCIYSKHGRRHIDFDDKRVRTRWTSGCVLGARNDYGHDRERRDI